MPQTEGVAAGVTIMGLDANGAAASSLRGAHSLFVAWFLSNLSSSKPVTLVFPRGRLFSLELLRDNGSVAWQSAAPPAADDYTIVVDPGDRTGIPLNPPPPDLPQQLTTIALAEIIQEGGIPSAETLRVRMSLPALNAEQVFEVVLTG